MCSEPDKSQEEARLKWYEEQVAFVTVLMGTHPGRQKLRTAVHYYGCLWYQELHSPYVYAMLEVSDPNTSPEEARLECDQEQEAKKKCRIEAWRAQASQYVNEDRHEARKA